MIVAEPLRLTCPVCPIDPGHAGISGLVVLGGQDIRGAAGRLMLNVFAAFAQFELEIMKERQREGIADAKAAGRYKGRKPTARAKAADAVRLFKEGKRVSQVAQQLGIGRASVYRALEDAGLHS